jgi:anti-sigma B factor antagonist
MKIQASEIDDITILEIDGMITLGSDTRLAEAFADLIGRGRKKVVLDMTKVKYIDSIGMGQLAGGYTALEEAGGSLALAQPNNKIKELLKLTGLQQHILTFPTVEDALNSL